MSAADKAVTRPGKNRVFWLMIAIPVVGAILTLTFLTIAISLPLTVVGDAEQPGLNKTSWRRAP